jgi:hypothetical protein
MAAHHDCTVRSIMLLPYDPGNAFRVSRLRLSAKYASSVPRLYLVLTGAVLDTHTCIQLLVAAVTEFLAAYPDDFKESSAYDTTGRNDCQVEHHA